MITTHRRQFAAICRQRGHDLAAAMACVVAQDGDRWTVDETHPAYPRRRVPQPPTLLQKAANFAAAAASHVAAGMPQASQEQIDARFAICQTCDLFDGRACTKCGCPIVREKAYISKLSWAGERCPVGKWGPVDSPATVASERSDHAEDATDGCSGEAGPSV